MSAETKHLFHVFSTFDAGGPQVRTCDIIDALGGAFRHSILSLDGRVGCVSRLEGRDNVELVAPGFRTSGLAFPLRLASLLVSFEPDLVLSYNWGAIETILSAKLCKGAPVLHAEDGFGADEADRLLRRRSWGRALLLRAAKGLVVPSRGLVEIAVHLWRVPRDRVHYVPNGIDTDCFAPGDRVTARRELGLPERGFLVGSVGHLRAEKDYSLLVEAFARAARDSADMHVVLVGDGPEHEHLSAVADSLGVRERVHFLGSVPETAPVYRALDLFALSSRTEQMPVALLEAMSTGLPAISTDVGDIARMLSAANASYLDFPTTAEAYARQLVALERDADLRARLGDANRRRCLHDFPRSRMIERYRELYGAMIEGAA